MLTALLLLQLVQTKAPATADIQEVLNSKVAEIATRTGAPGLSVAIVDANGKVFTACAGFSVSDATVAMTPQNVFCAGSTGKMLVGAAIALLVEEGKLSLDEPLKSTFASDKWFAELPNHEDLTLRHLLNHTSGLGDHVYNQGFLATVFKEPDKVWRAEELVAYLSGTKAPFGAGKGWAYSDTNYVLAGLVLERATGRGLFEFAQERILKPAKVSEVWPALSRTHDNLCDGLNMPDSPLKVTGWMLKDGRLPFNPQMEHGGGGTFTTPRGIAQWAKKLYEGKAVSAEAVDLITTGVPSKLGRDQKYGLGCMIRPTTAGLSYGHGGWFPGYLTDVMYLVDHKMAIAVQVNTDNFQKLGGSPEQFSREILRALYDAV